MKIQIDIKKEFVEQKKERPVYQNLFLIQNHQEKSQKENILVQDQKADQIQGIPIRIEKVQDIKTLEEKIQLKKKIEMIRPKITKIIISKKEAIQEVQISQIIETIDQDQFLIIALKEEKIEMKNTIHLLLQKNTKKIKIGMIARNLLIPKNLRIN